MPFVVDASCAAVWVLPDEASPLADAAERRLGTDQALVPALFWFEIRNVLVLAERRGRIDPARTNEALARFEGMGFAVDALPPGEEAVRLAREHGLTVYDAAYLELARRRAVPLATLDRQLVRAAAAAGVELLPA